MNFGIWQFGLCSVLLLTATTARGQDYRIYTRVSLQETAVPDSPQEVIGRSLTIWHAGKVYDYMDSVDELVIYDPQQNRYTILNGVYELACTVEFGELRQYIKVARTEAHDFMAELAEGDRPDAARAIAKITFQLNPQFEFQFDASTRTLRCDNPQMSYEVAAVDAPNPDISAAFRRYADSAAQLNFVLHGQSLMPDARMLVNAALEERQLIPAKVQLSLKDQRETVLTAEHTIHWELSPVDRTQLMEWKQLQQDGSLKFVSFQEYQRALFQKLP